MTEPSTDYPAWVRSLVNLCPQRTCGACGAKYRELFGPYKGHCIKGSATRDTIPEYPSQTYREGMTCAVCGEGFAGGNTLAKYCSGECKRLVDYMRQNHQYVASEINAMVPMGWRIKTMDLHPHGVTFHFAHRHTRTYRYVGGSPDRRVIAKTIADWLTT